MPAATKLPAVADGCEVRYQQPDHEYRRHDSTSQSELKEILKSPAHYLARYGPDAAPFFPSKNMIIGTALHSRVLEPHLFDSQFCDRSEVAKEPTVSELKEQLTEEGIEFKASAKKPELMALAYPDGLPKEKRTTLASEDFAIVCGMGEALRTHGITGDWFNPGQSNYRRTNELSIYLDAATSGFGFPVKGRIDRLERTATGWRILDLKSTDTASAGEFQRKAWNLGYDLQAWFYSMLVQKALGGTVEFVFVAVERNRPHGIGLYKASQKLLASGEKKAIYAAQELSFCKQTGNFPGYPEEILSLEPPRWADTSSLDQPEF